MDELGLYTVTVFQTNPQGEPAERQLVTMSDKLPDNMKLIEEYQNMISARIIGGKILELEHSNLAGPMVKFKTIVDFHRVMEADTCLGLFFTQQRGYITK